MERREEEEKEEKRGIFDEERETRRQERELRKLEMEAEILRQKEAAEAAKWEYELELARLGNLDDCPLDIEDGAQAPKLPLFVYGKDDLDAYLQRFERFADTAKWQKLDGHLISVLCFLDEHLKCTHAYLKKQLEITIKLKLRWWRDMILQKTAIVVNLGHLNLKLIDESPDQFMVKLERYLLRWLELSETGRTFDGLKDLIVKEKFIDSCPKYENLYRRQSVSAATDWP